MRVYLDVQQQTQMAMPSVSRVRSWIRTTLLLASYTEPSAHLTLRLVEPDEMRTLNHTFRHKDYVTNVLSFPFDNPLPWVKDTFLGDIVICPQVVQHEADVQHKQYSDHMTHLVVHGTLHLLGFDHEIEADAEDMESLEIKILASLKIQNPYLEQ